MGNFKNITVTVEGLELIASYGEDHGDIVNRVSNLITKLGYTLGDVTGNNNDYEKETTMWFEIKEFSDITMEDWLTHEKRCYAMMDKYLA